MVGSIYPGDELLMFAFNAVITNSFPLPFIGFVIFGYGNNGGVKVSMTNLVSNTGVVATDVTGVGTARYGLAAASF